MGVSITNIAKGQSLTPPRLALYGVDGIGKTLFASLAPSPIFIFTEPGLGKLDVARFTPEVDPFDPDNKSYVFRSWESVLSAVGALYTEKHEYQTVVIDTLDALEPLLWRATAQNHGKADIEAFGYGKGYVYAVDEARTLLAGLDALCNERGMAVILLAHAQAKRYEAPDHEPYDRYQMRVQEKLAALVSYWSDAVLFTNYRVHVVRDQDKFDKNKQTARGVGVGERLLYSEERPAWHAKNRYSLPPEMKLDWAELQGAIARGLVQPQPTADSA